MADSRGLPVISASGFHASAYANGLSLGVAALLPEFRTPSRMAMAYTRLIFGRTGPAGVWWGLPLLHFPGHNTAATGIAASVVNLAALCVCMRTTVITLAFALLDHVSVVASLAHAVSVLAFLSALTMMLLERGLLPRLANTHFPYAGALRNAETTGFRGRRGHAIANGFTAC